MVTLDESPRPGCLISTPAGLFGSAENVTAVKLWGPEGQVEVLDWSVFTFSGSEKVGNCKRARLAGRVCLPRRRRIVGGLSLARPVRFPSRLTSTRSVGAETRRGPATMRPRALASSRPLIRFVTPPANAFVASGLAAPGQRGRHHPGRDEPGLTLPVRRSRRDRHRQGRALLVRQAGQELVSLPKAVWLSSRRDPEVGGPCPTCPRRSRCTW